MTDEPGVVPYDDPAGEWGSVKALGGILLSEPAIVTVRSNDQFNTTIYGYHDRFRGVRGTRMTLFMHRNDIERFSLAEGDKVRLTTEMGDDAVERHVDGFVVTPYDIPEGCASAYYPEANPLMPMWHVAEGAGTPAAKSITVRVAKLPDAPQHLEATSGALSLTA